MDDLELPPIPEVIEEKRRGGLFGRLFKRRAKKDNQYSKEEERILPSNPEIPPEKYFVMVSGDKIKNLDELKAFLEFMDDETFNYHVNSQKNDFAKWVDNVLNRKDLADKLRGAKTREEMLNVLEEFTGGKENNEGMASGAVKKETTVPLFEPLSSEDTGKNRPSESKKLEGLNKPSGQNLEKEEAVDLNKIMKPTEVKKQQELEQNPQSLLPPEISPSNMLLENPKVKKESKEVKGKEVINEINNNQPLRLIKPHQLIKKKRPELNNREAIRKLRSYEKQIKVKEKTYSNLLNQKDSIIEQHKNKINSLESEKKKLEQELEETKKKLTSLISSFEREKNGFLAKQKLVDKDLNEIEEKKELLKRKEELILKRVQELNNAKETLDNKEVELASRLKVLDQEREMLSKKEDEVMEKLNELDKRGKELNERNKELDKKLEAIDKGLSKLEIKKQSLSAEAEKLKGLRDELYEKKRMLNKREKDVNRAFEKIEKAKNLMRALPKLEKKYLKLSKKVPKLEKEYGELTDKKKNYESNLKNREKVIEQKEQEIKARETALDDKKEKLLRIQYRLIEEKKKLEDDRLKVYLQAHNLGSSESSQALNTPALNREKEYSELLRPLPEVSVEKTNSLITETKEAIESKDFARANELIKKLEMLYSKVSEPQQKKDFYYKILDLKTDLRLAML